MTAMTFRPVSSGGADPDFTAGTTDAHTDATTLTTEQLWVRLSWHSTDAPIGYAVGYGGTIAALDVERQHAAGTAAVLAYYERDDQLEAAIAADLATYYTHGSAR